MQSLRIGVLYSTAGPYAAIGRDCRDGVDFALAELEHQSDKLGVRVDPVFRDPAGDLSAYVEHGRALIRDEGCRHILGTITSAARKEVIPLVEKHDGLLWYVCPYEGYEANENVIYTGACPNQHLVPLLDHLMPSTGRRVYTVGANYVWGWEMNRLARELIVASGGEVVGERYLPLEETDVGRIIADIERQRPDFILNNLIGPSSYAFLGAIRRLGERDGRFGPERCPVASCDLTECELGEIAQGAAVGQLSAASYFDSLATPENEDFKARVLRHFGRNRRISSFFASAAVTLRLCAEAFAAAASDEPADLREALYQNTYETPFGALRIDARTNHAALPFHLGRITASGSFDIAVSRPAMAADPYLTGQPSRSAAPKLRIVS
jgi:branched-chain amino acid transport system substrate-binding protein